MDSENLIPFGSREYWIFLGMLLMARGCDFLSTWVATPSLRLEANPLARRLGWKWGMAFNGVVCVFLAAWPFPAIVVATTSVLVAARNFKSAWWMRGLGELEYLGFVLEMLRRGGKGLYVMCVLGETLLMAAVGMAIVLYSPVDSVAGAVGMGLVVYAVVVGFYMLLALRRMP